MAEPSDGLMDWATLIAMTGNRPFMWVRRPYVYGLITLWCGFSLGQRDAPWECFLGWLEQRYPAAGGDRLTVDDLLRRAVGAGEQFTDEEDDRALTLLVRLAQEHIEEEEQRGAGGW